jgi:kynurenine formamidase
MLADNSNKKEYIDLSHVLYDGMPGFSLKRNNETVQYSIKVKPFLTHEESLPFFKGKCSFEITEVTFQTSIGTYLDAPYHRYHELRDISQIALSELILPGIVIKPDVKDIETSIGIECLPDGIDFAGKAVLFCFGWDQYWGQPEYFKYPYLDKKLIEWLVSKKVKLVGVDTPNIDNSNDLERPAHTLLLKEDIFIVENLTNLEQITGRKFIFFAMPVKIMGAAAMPVRAFAEIMRE